jgi:hypothetical protein
MNELEAMGMMGEVSSKDPDPEPKPEPIAKDDEKPFDDEIAIKGLQEVLERGVESFSANHVTGIAESALKMLEFYNSKFMLAEERRSQEIKTIQGSNEIIMEYEDIVGGDLDLSRGFACLRVEEGDEPGDLIVFLKGQFLGQVLERDGRDRFRALVKRDGKIAESAHGDRAEAIGAIIVKNIDIIAGELEKARSGR